MSDVHVAVVGAGIGGLVAALELACRGLRVTVISPGATPMAARPATVPVTVRVADASGTNFDEVQVRIT